MKIARIRGTIFFGPETTYEKLLRTLAMLPEK